MAENGLCAMTRPTALAAARNRAAVMAELRRLMPRMGEQRKPLPFGLAAIDSHLPDGGLAFGFIAAILARIFLPPPERGRTTAEGCRVGVSAHTGPSPDRLRRSGPPLSGEGHHLPLVVVMPTYGLRPYRPHGR